jgi:hypothetical protein
MLVGFAAGLDIGLITKSILGKSASVQESNRCDRQLPTSGAITGQNASGPGNSEMLDWRV